jgi:regulatory protein
MQGKGNDGHTREDPLREARKKAECLISVRERSEVELRERLKRAGFKDAVVEQVIGEALAVGLVDDSRFVELYVAGKKRSGWGQARIERELRRYGIELQQQGSYPDEFFSEEEECERAFACLEGFRSRAKDQEAARYRHLLSKGFSQQVAWRTLRSL